MDKYKVELTENDIREIIKARAKASKDNVRVREELADVMRYVNSKNRRIENLEGLLKAILTVLLCVFWLLVGFYLGHLNLV